MAALSYSDRDLELILPLTFSFVEKYIKSNKKSSGEKSINKGFLYFSENYVHDLKVEVLGEGCQVTGKCYRSQRKNLDAHQFTIDFLSRTAPDPAISRAYCSCTIGLSGLCGHVVGALYQLAKLKKLNLKALPEDVAKTSQPQTHHLPRGPKIQGQTVQDLEVSGYSKGRISLDSVPRTVKSTLYNPIRGAGVDLESGIKELRSADSQMLILPAMELQNIPKVGSGLVPKGSILSYQQKLESDCIINLYDGSPFPDLPCSNVMENMLNNVLNMKQTTEVENLKLTVSEVSKFEKQTRLQSQSPLWYRIRKHRITASKIGDIYKRRKDYDTLAERLKSTRRVTTQAMRHGLVSEPMAATYYAQTKQNKVNLYPCGVVVSVWSPWLAARPDRKVYDPNMAPPFGLLEIKCPQVGSVLKAKYLSKDQEGIPKLKRNHSYYYQVLTQLAVTGLSWCDLFVWCQNDYHLETI